ncbi:MAG: efflux RND transporter permease subunit [Pseudodesulfovibrio sp.]|uniref:Acriflavin resistance protein n=1 Tax=Pseudodesulfovibrio aespoeensis (strain ATCC 700646 / DSM 10631 / Aspo-2) TaxID=643562 RepID=E6VS60_PSEA9|nr:MULTISPECIES: efflux RND transporter permease subunit [Pseudodesulfovibrio]MBU4191315.1 efflux RND transporter permease subunit [Pseudomonadota bacterium]ADU63105.1 acriflavin resistance protein [Pseudodesulfovibrio aespoeensis Aspo-2]MBU4474119.1 efflux RND transporter permease subunit [Pseudomonadota bacterium]MBU4516813.1 efflux RND transporter permease subunit [Pseudomonadota bacterium]MBU4523131.1 efflux RND transporter permease subunit [Pseudomonadota bacterium]
MQVTELFIRRPVMTALTMLGLLFFGIVSYLNMPVSYLPAVEFPTIQVTASMSGANPTTMAASVASPLEREFSSIAGLQSMSSVNSLGSTTITLQFDLNREIDGAALDVQSAIARAASDLPDQITEDPSFQKVNPADTPILYLSVRSDTLPMSTVNDYSKTFLTQTISMIPGVAQVLIYGEKQYAVRIRLDPRELAARSLGIDEVKTAVEQANVNLPLGTLEGTEQSLMIQDNGQLTSADQYADIIAAYRDGQPVRLSDIALVEDGVKDERFSSWLNDDHSLTIAVKRQPGTNTIDIVDSIRQKLPWITSQMPAGIKLDIVHDNSKFIEESVNDVKFTLGLAVALVILVVFIFLRNLASTFIASVAIPFSIVATFAVMHAMDFTLDTFSLMALTLCVGFVVDDAIVMIENIIRHLEMGKTPMQAARDGSSEIGFTIISMTLSLAIVFVPIMFMAGIIGRVLHEFAMTITAAILVSGVVSLSLTPMLGSRMLKSKSRIAESDPVFDRLMSWYRSSLSLCLRHRAATMVASALLFAATAAAFMVIPKGFLPSDDQGLIMGFTQARQGISYDSLERQQKETIPIIAANAGIRDQIQIIGNPLSNQGMIVALLKPASKRKSLDEILAELWGPINTLPGLEVYLVNPPMIPIGGKQAKGDYLFTLLSPDSDTLYKSAQSFDVDMRKHPLLTGVNSDLQISTPQVEIDINRDMASSLGVSANDIENALFTAYGERQISTIYTVTDEYKVIMQLKPEFQKNADALSMLYIRSSAGNLVRLDALAQIRESTGPVTVNHTGQLESVTFSFSGKPGTSMGQITEAVQALALEKLPQTVSTLFEGTAGAFAESMNSLYFLLFIAIVAIYILLGCLYESFIHPLTILSGLPSAAFGGLITLMLFGYDLDLYGMVGIIMLIGIVKKNSIMVVDFAIQAEKTGLTPEEAAFQGATTRFRPILMTTLAAIMGALPIALGFGAGAEIRRPLGLAVVGGLAFSQIVTLYLTPIFYTYMDEFQHWLDARTAQPEATEGEA